MSASIPTTGTGSPGPLRFCARPDGPLSAFAPAQSPRNAYDFLLVELTRPREELYARIEARVDAMFDRGLVREVAALKSRAYGPEAPGMKAIGYSEFFELDEGGNPLPAAVLRERIKLDSRRYAKRQETFFRGLPGPAPDRGEGRGWPFSRRRRA